MTRMDGVLAAVIEGRADLLGALDELEKFPSAGPSSEINDLRLIVGDLARMVSGWERERDRWQ